MPSELYFSASPSQVHCHVYIIPCLSSSSIYNVHIHIKFILYSSSCKPPTLTPSHSHLSPSPSSFHPTPTRDITHLQIASSKPAFHGCLSFLPGLRSARIRSRGREAHYEIIPHMLNSLSLARRILRLLDSFMMSLTDRSTDPISKTYSDSPISPTRSLSGVKGKPWRESVTPCLSKLIGLAPAHNLLTIEQ